MKNGEGDGKETDNDDDDGDDDGDDDDDSGDHGQHFFWTKDASLHHPSFRQMNSTNEFTDGPSALFGAKIRQVSNSHSDLLHKFRFTVSDKYHQNNLS